MNTNAAQIAEVADNLAKVQSFDPWSAKWISEAHMLLRGLAAREPVAEVVEWTEDDGTSKHVVSFLCPIAEIPIGAKLYAATASAKPTQPVEAVDRVMPYTGLEAASMMRTVIDDILMQSKGTHETAHQFVSWHLPRVRSLLTDIDAALAHPRPTGDAVGFDRSRETPRRQQAVEKLLELGWTYHHENGWTAPTVGQAGEVVALRIVGRHGPYGWHDASEIDKENPPELIVGEGERVEYAYAQPRTVGVPDGWQNIATAPNDGTPHVRGLHVYGPDGKYLYWEEVAGHIDTEDGAFYSEGDVSGWDANDFSHWHALAAAPAPGKGGEA